MAKSRVCLRFTTASAATLLAAATTLAQTFPSDPDWVPLTKGGTTLFDAAADVPVAAEKDLVSINESPAMWFFDNAYLYFRLRLDGSPGTIGALSNSAAWGCQISSDGDAADYEWAAVLTGDEQIKVCAAGQSDVLTHPADLPTGASSQVASNSSNTRVVSDGSADFFVDFATVLPSGTRCDGPLRLVCGTNSLKTCALSNGASGDIAGIGAAANPTWTDVASDLIVLGCSGGLLCDPSDGACVLCMADDDCMNVDPSLPRCIDRACFECRVETEDVDCQAPEPHCLAETGTCVECLSSANCSEGLSCDGGTHTCVATPMLAPNGLVVDEVGDGVLDPGEGVVVAPAWSNDGPAAAVNVTGTAANLQGPVTTSYDIDDFSATYGSIAALGSSNCSVSNDCYLMTIEAPADRTQLHWDATFEETLSTGDLETWTLHVGKSFADEPPSAPFYPEVETGLHRGVSNGCGGGNYCPTDLLFRAEAAALLLRAAGIAPAACNPGSEMFPDDVPAIDLSCPWVEEAARRGIMAACGPGRFCPELAVTREQMAFYLLRAVEGSSYVPPPVMDCLEGDEPYDDVEADSVYCRWIKDIKSRGITAGCGLDAFCPAGPVTRDVMASLLSHAFALTLYSP